MPSSQQARAQPVRGAAVETIANAIIEMTLMNSVAITSDEEYFDSDGNGNSDSTYNGMSRLATLSEQSDLDF